MGFAVVKPPATAARSISALLDFFAIVLDLSIDLDLIPNSNSFSFIGIHFQAEFWSTVIAQNN